MSERSNIEKEFENLRPSNDGIEDFNIINKRLNAAYRLFKQKVFPDEIGEINKRRKNYGIDKVQISLKAERKISNDLTGLCFSGGGIRSARDTRKYPAGAGCYRSTNGRREHDEDGGCERHRCRRRRADPECLRLARLRLFQRRR